MFLRPIMLCVSISSHYLLSLLNLTCSGPHSAEMTCQLSCLTSNTPLSGYCSRVEHRLEAVHLCPGIGLSVHEAGFIRTS